MCSNIYLVFMYKPIIHFVFKHLSCFYVEACNPLIVQTLCCTLFSIKLISIDEIKKKKLIAQSCVLNILHCLAHRSQPYEPDP